MTIYPEAFSSEQEDIALATLRAVAIEDDGGLALTLIEALYRLQKQHQFDADPSASVQQMQRLLEDYVSSLNNGGAQ